MRKRVFGLNWTDLLVITACGMTFTAAIVSQIHHAPPPGPPTELAIQQMAEELGVTPDQLRRAAEIVPPPARGMRPSPEQRDTARQALASILNVSLDRLDTVMGQHRPPGD